MRHSLQLKLLYSFMLVIVVALTGVSVGVALLIKEQVVSGKQQELITKGNELAQVINSFYQKNGSQEQLGQFLNSVDSFLSSRVWIVNSSRQVIAVSNSGRGMGRGRHLAMGPGPMYGGMGGMGGVGAVINQLDPVFAGKTWMQTFDNPVYGEKMLVVAVPIPKSGGGVNGAVILNTPVAGIDQFMEHIYYYIGAAGLVAVVLALLVVNRLTRKIIRPLQGMQEIAGAMARGDYSRLVPVETSDEVGHLGLALNALSRDLAKYVAELNQMEKLRRDFVANVSHELRSPLTIIRGYNEAMLDGTIDDPLLVQKYHRLMREETVRLEHLINDLLDLSRLQAGKLAADKDKIPLAAVADSVVNMLQQQARQKQVNLVAQTKEPLPLMMGHGDRITQLLLIIMDNALKYTPAGGTVTVSTFPEAAAVVLQVADTGPGIPAEDLPHIWERFYKVDKSHSRTDQGTGLGLAIAREIIELHQAVAEVTSTPGQGTVFTIKFPLAAAGSDGR